ncbi:MAG TPA: hypothetical protein GX011_07680 [Clostridiales bacterium]|jgi:hypothetical protein|nr:hypothetical protein [Clostridiales bacterium]
MDDINGKEEKYTGEVGPDGLPHGRGTIDFGDGRRYSGTIDGASQTGRGVYYYPDGSRFIGGFTVNTEYPAWRFVYPDGREVAGFVSRFPAGDEEVGRGEFNEIDALCAEITRAAKALGLLVEYNARTILADALCRRGEGDVEAAVRAAAIGCSDMLTVPFVIRYIYG